MRGIKSQKEESVLDPGSIREPVDLFTEKGKT